MSDEAKILEGLNERQIQAVQHIEGPLLVLAGAGSGKTRVITRRVAFMIANGINPESIVAITFTNKAANEMLHRVRDATTKYAGDVEGRPHISTFHAFTTFLLRIYGRVINIDPNFTIFDETDRKKLIKLASGDAGALPVGLTVAKVADRIGYAKTHGILPDTIDQFPGLPEYHRPAIARIYRRYESLVRENGGLDFNDLLIRGLELLTVPEAAEAIRGKYHYLLIDEYQDTNRIQYQIARELVGAGRNICATGDPDQSIYGWRGADIKNIMSFQDDYPDAVVVKLETNYRSTAHILSAADSVIKNNLNRKKKTLVPHLGQGQQVQVHVSDDEKQEADEVVEIVEKAHGDDVPYSEIAVFCRVNSLLRNVEQSLRHANVPYELARGVGFFQKKEIRDLVAYLRVVVNPDDAVALERMINTPVRGIGLQSQSTLKEYAAQNGISLLQAVNSASQIPELGKSQVSVERFAGLMKELVTLKDQADVPMFVETVINKSGLRAHYQKQSDKLDRPDELTPVANLDEFISTAQSFQNNDDIIGQKNIDQFLVEVSLTSDIDSVKGDDKVTLLTMHAAKGLEFTTVIVIAAEEEIIPHSMSMQDGVEEERRLFFVAMTRAKLHLHLCHVHCRSTRGSFRRSMPSRFIREIDAKDVAGMDFTAFEKPARNFQFVINPKKQDDQDDSDRAMPKCSYSSGQRIYHDKFGYGVIEDIYLSGNRYTASIRFHSAGVRKIVVDIAPIHPVT